MKIPPGYIDLQVNGFLGVDFSVPGLTVGAVRRVTQALAERGTAAFCPTLVSSPPETYEANLPVLADAMRQPDLRERLLGIHLEGPFLAPESRGVHPASCLCRPSVERFEGWQRAAENHIRILTLAPELEGAEEVIRAAAEQGVVVSLGHHLADAGAMDRAVRAGARSCTHLGNGIPLMLPRHPNPVWSQLAEDRLIGMFICDGHHLPVEFIRVAWRAKSIERFIAVSDVAAIAGLPPGPCRYLDADVVLESSGRISRRDGGGLAGSGMTLAEGLSWLRAQGLASAAELYAIGRRNPLALLGIQDDSRSHRKPRENPFRCIVLC